MIVMNTQAGVRISQIKQYISSLNDHVNANDYRGTMNIVNRFKKAVLKQDPQLHANQFLLDCLKTKNQKLQAELQLLQVQKKHLEEKLNTNTHITKSMKQVKVGVFISRLTVSLNDVKKVEYDDVSLNCDYQKIYVSSLMGSKYQDYILGVDFVQNVEYKNCYAHLQYQQTQNVNVLIRFQSDKDMQRWVIGLKFGMLIQSSKKRGKLFQIKKEETPVSTVVSSPQHQQTGPVTSSLNHHSTVPTPYVPVITFAAKPASPSESIISERKDKSMQRSLNDKLQKNTQRSLVNALNFQTNNANSRRSLNPSATTIGTKRLDVNRPANLQSLTTRYRGLSQNMDTSFQISKIYRTNQNGNPRKQSEDISKSIINQNYHERMLETLHSQQANESEQKSENENKLPQVQPSLQNFRSQSYVMTDSDIRSNRVKSLQEKKKELLTQASLTVPSQKLSFQFEINKVSWGGIQEMQDQNKSKSSNKMSSKQRRESIITQSQYNGSKQSSHKRDDKQSEHITQKSEEQSPKFPKNFKVYTSPNLQNLEVPSKIKYEGGLGIQLHPVVRQQQKVKFANMGDTMPKFVDKIQRSDKESQSIASHSMTSQSQSHGHSDSFSHENHTESEDNNQRAEELKKGIILTKYSENGFWPHQKIIYLSQNENDLCYRDLKDKKIKKIKISNIKRVDYKRYDKGIIKHVTKIEEDRCLVVNAETEEGKQKNFEFVSAHSQPLERFSNNLNLWIQYYKKT